MSHKATEVYSGKNPVPKVALKSILDPSGATEAKARRLVGQNNKDEEEAEIATERAARQMAKGKEVTVKDPVTGEETTVLGGDDRASDDTGGNILSMDYPPPDWSAHRTFVLSRARSAAKRIVVAYTTFPFLLLAISHLLRFTTKQGYPSFNNTYIGTLSFLVAALLPPTALSYILLYALHNESAEDFADRALDSERTRGMAAGQDKDRDGKVEASERAKESAEWLNSVLRGVWPIINSDMFNSGVDMLEDIMQASVPKFIHSVRIADLGQGTNPMRVTSIRSLTDAEREDVLADLDDTAGGRIARDHVNIEVSYAYRALPSGAKAREKAHNAHLLIEFFLGLKGVYEFNLPVWVELTGISGTARARMELISNPPFLKTTVVTLMGLPRVSISVVPMAESLPNIMNIPVLSSFISKSIDAACAEYVAPRSLTLDLQQLISGDDIKKDTEAIGALIIHIHRAIDLETMDTRNSSDPADPYVTVAYSRQGRPLYSTRIVFADLNPCFEETTAIPIDANAVKIREKLSVQVWDSDRASADDMMGYVDIDILELIRSKNTPHRCITKLESPGAEQRAGSLEYTVGYYSKMTPNSELASDGSDPAIPDDIKEHNSDFREARAVALNDLEAAVLVTPPDPAWPSGILSIQVHEIRGLKVKTEGREKSVLGNAKREGEKGQDDNGVEEEEGSHLPSSYCTIAINDDLVYATRVKPITSSPTFNAGTERFIRDWRTAHASVSVRDSRMREEDPILGIVFLKLSDLLVHASETTRFFPLENGLGYGSVRVSVLFRPVEASLPPNLLGFDVGTLLIRRLKVEPCFEEPKSSSLQPSEIRFKTTTSSVKDSIRTSYGDHGDTVWDAKERPITLPIQHRYSTALIMTFKARGSLKADKVGMAVLWLRDVIDKKDMCIEVTIFKAHDYSRLKQNYAPPEGNLEMWNQDKVKYVRIGTLRIDLLFTPGRKEFHKKELDTRDPAQKGIWDEVDRRSAAGFQDEVGKQGGDGKLVTGENTEVDASEAVIEECGSAKPHQTTDLERESRDLNSDTRDDERGLLSRLRDWKQHEKELYQQHRGIMQVKPARTVKWLGDNIGEAGHKIKDRFQMKSRQPDIETEV